MTHARRENVGRALSTAADQGVLTKDRHRRGTGCQYTFLEVLDRVVPDDRGGLQVSLDEKSRA